MRDAVPIIQAILLIAAPSPGAISAWARPLPASSYFRFPVFSCLTTSTSCSPSSPSWPPDIYMASDAGGTVRTLRIIQGFITIVLPILLLLICWLFHFSGWPFLMVLLFLLSFLPFILFRGSQLPVSIAPQLLDGPADLCLLSILFFIPLFLIPGRNSRGTCSDQAREERSGRRLRRHVPLSASPGYR